jgi:hypothetical protein
MLDRATGEVIGGETLHRYRCLSVETVPYDLLRQGSKKEAASEVGVTGAAFAVRPSIGQTVR